MPIYLPSEVDYFPHPYLSYEDGFLAIGGRLDMQSLLLSYQWGIFPWTSAEQPLLWWTPHPRCVLYPENLKVSKSMRPFLNGDKWRWTIDTCFQDVLHRCRDKKRAGQEGTWLFEELEEVIIQLHKAGYAHSVEVWQDDKLIGGLYGLSLGRIFYGESMFADVSNASKYGFIQFVRWLQQNEHDMIDCQQETPHLMSMGAETISQKRFHDTLKSNIFNPTKTGKWSR